NTIGPENPRRNAIFHLLREFHVDQLAQGRLYVDIATTVWGYKALDDDDDLMQAVSLFPNIQYHAQVLNHFTGKPINECERLVLSSRGGYSKDEHAHLGDLGGCRFNVREPTRLGTEYFQLYDTSKSVTYNVVLKQKAKRTSPYNCEKDWAQERTTYFIPLQEAFRTAGVTHSVAVRFESRVPYSSYGRVHQLIPVATLSQWVLWVDDKVYWGYKWRRLMAINNVLNRFFTSEARSSITSQQVREYGSLVITLVWMANALINRPDDGGHWDEIRDSASVHGIVDGQVVVLRDLTMFNLHSLYLDHLPRVSSQRTASPRTIQYLFSSDKVLSSTMLVAKLQGRRDQPVTNTSVTRPERITEDVWGLNDPEEQLAAVTRPLPGPRRGNRQQTVSYGQLEDAPNMFENLFAQQEPVRYPSQEIDPEERDMGPSLDRRVSDIVQQFPSQIFGKAPNKKQKQESWCSLGPYDVSYKTFCDPTLPNMIFTSWVDCGHRDERWDITVKAYFPTLDEHLILESKAANANSQGLHCLEAWKEWKVLLNEVNTETRKEIIKEVRKRINLEWRWLPWFYSNHLWKTGTVGGRTPGKIPKGEKEGGPWI
ncbi:hypothetical protein FRC11_011991, partial [Ceratobasidium sp. 423]